MSRKVQSFADKTTSDAADAFGINNVSQWKEMCLHNRKKKTFNIYRGPLRIWLQKHTPTYTHARLHAGARESATYASHLRLPLLQQGLQSFLCCSSLVVIAHDQNDVIPLELAHHVEPHLGLVRVGRYRAQEGEVDTLEVRVGKKCLSRGYTKARGNFASLEFNHFNCN